MGGLRLSLPYVSGMVVSVTVPELMLPVEKGVLLLNSVGFVLNFSVQNSFLKHSSCCHHYRSLLKIWFLKISTWAVLFFGLGCVAALHQNFCSTSGEVPLNPKIIPQATIFDRHNKRVVILLYHTITVLCPVRNRVHYSDQKGLELVWSVWPPSQCSPKYSFGYIIKHWSLEPLFEGGVSVSYEERVVVILFSGSRVSKADLKHHRKARIRGTSCKQPRSDCHLC